jgi:hypothetical protein
MKRHWIGAAVVSCVVISAGLAGCGKSGPPEGSLEARIDTHGDEIMASSTKGEAREWMKDDKHVFFKGDRKAIAQDVEDFYTAGATQVLIGDIEVHDGISYGGSILVVLPKDASVRAKLFEVDKRVGPQFQEDPVTDKGQKYLYYGLD